MFVKNLSQKIYIYAWDTVNNVPKTGDASNITGTFSLDGGAESAIAAPNAHPVEIGHGVYCQTLAAAETNGDACAYTWSSSSTGIKIEPWLILTDRGGVSIDLTKLLPTPRAADALTDAEVEIRDVLWAALSYAVGQRDLLTGPARNQIATPEGTVIRTQDTDSLATPTYVH